MHFSTEELEKNVRAFVEHIRSSTGSKDDVLGGKKKCESPSRAAQPKLGSFSDFVTSEHPSCCQGTLEFNEGPWDSVTRRIELQDIFTSILGQGYETSSMLIRSMIINGKTWIIRKQAGMGSESEGG